ncbi:MAG TPA: UbiD family decarboxylase [Methanotrichaceae archaeon]|nr:UbiD family decarboxylase [Methanotrichaceae archaeon]HQF17696.1 UbiD family decarboxylase [Methanotrichaceae archaeon]HQI92268.1 UbiD family decarboxylase [Methanotrichaceae archaeon]HQJ29402.1 UbiD family decarboxylase [Methanotrichaceae archaeon]
MSFRDFLDGLRDDGSLVEIRGPVSPLYQAAEMAMDNRPLLFHDLQGGRGAVNLLGTRSLLGRALRIPATEMAHRLSSVSYDGQTHLVNSSPFQEVVSPPDLKRLPILTHFRGDGGPYITSAVVVSRLGERINACVHRLMVAGPDRLAARLVPGRHTHQMYCAAIKAEEPIPVAIAIGVDPVVLIAASTRVPENLEFQYAAALRGGPVELVELENGVPVPHAEIVLEGYLTRERMAEGPFVDITGTMDLVRQEPVVQIVRMMCRENPIYQALLPAGGEHKMLMGVPYEPLIYRAVSRVANVRNVLLTEGGCCYFHAVVQIDKQSEEDGKRAIEAAFQAHGSLKHVLVVDSDIDIFDPADLEFAIATRMRGDEDLYIYPNVRGSTLDPRSVEGMTTKVGADATARLDRLWKFKRVAKMSK